MINWKYMLFAQYPAIFLLTLFCLVSYLRVRKLSAIRSVFWVLMFGAALAASVLFAALGIHAGFWTLSGLFTLSLASWIGIALVVIAVVVRIVHLIDKKHSQQVMEKELKRAAEEKDAAVAQAHEEGRRAAQEEASQFFSAPFPSTEPEPAMQDSPSFDGAPAFDASPAFDSSPAPEAPPTDENGIMPGADTPIELKLDYPGSEESDADV